MSRIEQIPVVYEDESILIVDKPSGLLSQPGKGPDLSDSLLTRIRSYFPWAELVHRLDRDTSGLLVVALNADMHRAMSISFAERKVEKQYLGLCFGALIGTRGTIVSSLGRIGFNPPRYGEHQDGKLAVTHWQHLHHEIDRTRVLLTPITGRSHQLRVHLESIGHPLIGDPIYGFNDGERLMLHARQLNFQHPKSGQWIEVKSPAPF